MATKQLGDFEQEFEQLRVFPGSGAKRPQLAPELRVKVSRPYAIYYVQRGTHVLVVRVLHGSRDVAAIAQGGGFR